MLLFDMLGFNIGTGCIRCKLDRRITMKGQLSVSNTRNSFIKLSQALGATERYRNFRGNVNNFSL